MDSLERCRILCGISEDNTKKLGLLSVLLEKAREDIEAFCRDRNTASGKYKQGCYKEKYIIFWKTKNDCV